MQKKNLLNRQVHLSYIGAPGGIRTPSQLIRSWMDFRPSSKTGSIVYGVYLWGENLSIMSIVYTKSTPSARKLHAECIRKINLIDDLQTDQWCAG